MDQGMSARHLSESPIWLPQNQRLLSLDGKTLLLCQQDAREYPMAISVMQARPNGPDSGKVAIRVWQTDRGSVPFEGGGHIPTKRCSGWSAYLDESAVSQITEGAEHCDFTLRLAD
jgi:hypothetical protein